MDIASSATPTPLQQELYLNTLDPKKLMELYNDPNYPNDKTIVFNVLKTKDPNFARQLKTSRKYADMAAMGFPVAAAVKTIGALPAAYATYKSNARAGGKTRRNRRSLKQRKRKHSRRRR
jgi:hypothetical protein